MNRCEENSPENSQRFPEDAANVLLLWEGSNVCQFLPLTLSQETTGQQTPLTFAMRGLPWKIFSKTNPEEPESCDDKTVFNHTRTGNPNWEHSPLLLPRIPEHVNIERIPEPKITFSKRSISNVNLLNRNRRIVQFKLKSGEYRSGLSNQEHRKLSKAVPKSNQWQKALAYNLHKPISQQFSFGLHFRDLKFKSTIVKLPSVPGKTKEKENSENKIMNVTTCNYDELVGYADVLKLNNDVMELQSECKNIPQSSDDEDQNDETQSAMPWETDSESCPDKPSSYVCRPKFNITSESAAEGENTHRSDNQNCETQSSMLPETVSECCHDTPSSFNRLKPNIITAEMPTECTRDKNDGNYETHSAVSQEIDSTGCPDKPSNFAEQLNLNVSTRELLHGLAISPISDKEISQGILSRVNFRETESTMIATSSVFDKTSDKNATKKKMKKWKSANDITNVSTCNLDELTSYVDVLKLNDDANELKSEYENILQSSVQYKDENGVIHSVLHGERGSENCPDKSRYAGRLKHLRVSESATEGENIHHADDTDQNCETHSTMSLKIDSKCPDKPSSGAEQLNLVSANESARGLCTACDPDKGTSQDVSSGLNFRDGKLISFVNVPAVFGKSKKMMKKKKKKQKKHKTTANEITNITSNSDQLANYADVLKLNNDVMELQSKSGTISQSSGSSDIDQNLGTQCTMSPEIDSESCSDKPSSYAGRLKLNISITEMPAVGKNLHHCSSDNKDQNCETLRAMSTGLDSKYSSDKPSSYAGRLKLNINVNDIAPVCENIFINAGDSKDQNCETNSAISAEIDTENVPDEPTSYADLLKLNIKASEFDSESEHIYIFSSEMNGWSHKCSAGKINQWEIDETGHNSHSVSCDKLQTPKTQECMTSWTNTDGDIVSCSETESSEQICVTEPEELYHCLNEQDKHDCHAAVTDCTDPEQLSAMSSHFEFNYILRNNHQAVAPVSPRWREVQIPTEQTHKQNRMTAILEKPPFIHWSPIVNTNIRKEVKEERKDKNSLQDEHLLLDLDDDGDDGYPSSPNYMTLLSDSDSEVFTTEPSNYSADSYFRGLLEFPIPESQRPESWMQSYLTKVRGVDTSRGSQDCTGANPWWMFSQNSLENCQNQSEHTSSTGELKRQVTDLSARIQSAEEQIVTWKEVSAKLIVQHEQLQSRYEQEVRELTEKLEIEKTNSKRLQKDLCELAKNKKEAHMDAKMTELEVRANKLSRPINMYSQNKKSKFYNFGSNITPKISAPASASFHPQIVPLGVSPLQLMNHTTAVCNYPRMVISSALGPQLRPPREHPAVAALFSQLQTVFSPVSSVYRFSGIMNPYVRGQQHK